MENKKLKIAFLNISQGAVSRGGETLIENLAKEFSKRHSVDILGGNITPPLRWPVLWRFFIDPQGLSIAFFTIRQIGKLFSKKYDIVIPLNGGWQAIIVRLVTWLYGGKMVISAQSGVGWDDRINLLTFPNACIAPSSHALFWSKKFSPWIKSWYVPNGVDLVRFSPKGEKYKTKLVNPIVLCVGALVDQKRIDLVIRAVAKLQKVNLLIVGVGKQKENLTQLAEKLLQGRYEITNVAHDNMPQIYRAADVFTLVSAPTEAFGLVFVEAMATNLPIVAIADEQREEIIGAAGLYVDPFDTDAFAKTLESALKKKWGNDPRKQAEQFSWDKIAGQYEKIFFKI